MARPDGPSKKCDRKYLKSGDDIRAVLKAARGPVDDDDRHHARELSRRTHKEKGIKRKCVKNQRIQGSDPSGRIRETDEEVEKKIAFCCNVCHCPQRIKDRYGDDQNVQASEDGLYHRRCCHRTPRGKIPEDWQPEVGLAIEATLDALVNDQRSGFIRRDSYRQSRESHDEIGKALNIPVQDEEIPSAERIQVVYKKYRMNFQQENEMRNLDDQPVLADKMRSDDATGYSIIEKQFYQRHKNTTTKRGAAVVDLFGGIGAGVVCLKRLQIKIDKLVHVEHCQVANAVYIDNHGTPDDKVHVLVPTFEEFEEHLEQFMTQHGPFDIVIAGPPCVDYAAINANREGAAGLQGSYLLRTGHVICKIRQYNEKIGHPYPFFLVENVILTDQKDRRRVEKAFGTETVWYEKDSRDLTPLRRNRTYLSNIPLSQEELVDPPPRMCFDHDFDMGGAFFESGFCHLKAPGLMAHKGRLDDAPRMLIFKEMPDKSKGRYPEFLARTPNVAERERLMGFKTSEPSRGDKSEQQESTGYVSKPLRELFGNVMKALAEGLHTDWKRQTPMKHHHFAGDYHNFKGKHLPYQFYVQRYSEGPQCHIKMAPRLPHGTESEYESDKDESTDVDKALKGKPKPEYYTEEQFAKRLLGNSFSIPTVEWFLSPLTSLFSSQDYGDNFNYAFAWASWNKKDKVKTEPSEGVRAFLEVIDAASSQPVMADLSGGAAKSRKRTAAEALAKPSREKMEDVDNVALGVGEPDGCNSNVDVCDV